MKSLNHVARVVAQEVLAHEDIDSAAKKLRRNFVKFVEAGGGTVDKLKDEKGFINFDDDDIPVIHTVLTQLAQQRGFAYAFMKDHSRTPDLGDTHDFIQEIITRMEKDGMDEKQVIHFATTLDRLFQFSFMATIDYCHRMVDGIALNLMPYPYTHQMAFVKSFEDTLKRQYAISVVEAIMNTGELGAVIRDAKESGFIDEAVPNYGDDDIADEYKRRDAAVIEYLKANPEIRRFVESKAGGTVEEIWGVKLD